MIRDREYVKQDKNGKWRYDDKAWLYDRVLAFIVTTNRLDRTYFKQVLSVSARQIYIKFAPVGAGRPFAVARPSWSRKNRKVKRQMLAAVLRRLIADARIRIDGVHCADYKSMHGQSVRQRKMDVHLFGSDYDGVLRSYVETNVLQAMADALGEK